MISYRFELDRELKVSQKQHSSHTSSAQAQLISIFYSYTISDEKDENLWEPSSCCAH